ncbi:hypothetical protein LUZ61_002237 [Rhynchospora tenuis]|uniref:Lecithin-cholesterol acyltransferase-like 4 n=1 Tax=Rhynchospora tenuis TaxID=198213 RepID=A0AAD6ERI7_9POAL|nr:hypothetical protein LUZ61_002237 [Rhynchospora tenuis]
MAVLDELIRSIQLWVRASRKHEAHEANPELDPVLLVPGIGGSMLNAIDENGKTERVWVRILGADHEFRTKLWPRFDPSSGETISVDEKVKIEVPEDRHGLYAIDVLDPDMIIESEGVCYYHDMIVEMIKWGYEEGKTLFGFGYDFRQSNRLQETLDRFASKLELAYASSGGKKINVVTHSMGGLLVKCFMALHTDVFEKYVKCWIAIAAPFQGAPGYITSSLLNGCSFVEGLEAYFFISKWSMQQLLLECPSIYELMAAPSYKWENIPLLQLWTEKKDSESGKSSILLESYDPSKSLPLMVKALSNNAVELGGLQIPLPLNSEILKWANKTHELLASAKLPSSVRFYNIYGTNCGTPHSVCYGGQGDPVLDLKQLLFMEPKYIYVNGDGTVPVESAKADGLDAIARVGVPADHRGIICNRHVFRILKHWLKAGEPDPFYNPLNDFVILPTAFEVGNDNKDTDIHVTSVKEDWQLLSQKNCQGNDNDDLLAMVGSLSVSSEGKDGLTDEAHATVVVQTDSGKHVELRAIEVSD